MVAEIIEIFFTRVFDLSLAVQLLCVAVSTVLLLGVPSGTKFNPLKFAAEVVCLAAIFLVLNLTITVIAGVARLFVGSYWNYLIGIALYALVRSKHSIAARVTMASVVFSVIVLMAAFGTIVGNMLENHIGKFDIAITKNISSLLMVACSVVFYLYPVYRYEMNASSVALNATCSLLSAMLFIVYELLRAQNFSIEYAARMFSGYISIVIVAMLVINMVTYFMTYSTCRERERVLFYQAERQKSRSLEELLSLSESRLAELREVRHDVKNQYAYMQTMIEEGRYDDLKKYFEELVGTFSRPLGEMIESGNLFIDSALNLELSKARAVGIKLDVRVSVPHELPFSQNGILALFTNVIDNAIEACVREKVADAQIDVVVEMRGDYLFLCVTNPTKKTSVGEEGQTSKRDKRLHGYGMRIIRKVVKKYNGYYRCFVKDGYFVSEALLDTHYDGKPVKHVTRGGGV